MSWGQSKSLIAGASLAGAMLAAIAGASAASAEPAIIVKSTVSEYPVGSKIDDDATITLKDGDRVSVLTTRGSRTMRGPGAFLVGADPKSNRNRFANLKRKGAALKSGTGGLRSPSGAVSKARPQSPKVFYADVARSGRLCLVDTRDVSFWRPFDDLAATYLLSGPGLDLPVPITFDAGFSLVPPDSAPQTSAPITLMGDGTYTIVGGPAGDGPAMTIATVTIVDLGQNYERADLLAQALVENDCMAQFEVMSERLFAE